MNIISYGENNHFVISTIKTKVVRPRKVNIYFQSQRTSTKTDYRFFSIFYQTDNPVFKHCYVGNRSAQADKIEWKRLRHTLLRE